MADGTLALMQLAEANASGEAIGQVASFSGDVFIVRTDGTEVKGGQGTEIFQGDVVRTGDDGEVGLVFADDTTFSLGEDGEMTIDEMVYDAGSESGSASFSIAKGVFGFVSGQLAKVDPDAMVIDTPVATIGIRGSSGTGRAAPEGEESTFILVPDPDGTIGEIIIQTETGSVVMNVPYQASAVLSAFISPSAPVALPASVVARVFGNTVEALSTARADAGVQDGPADDSGGDSAAAAADEAPSGADAPEAEAEVSAADEAALEAAAASPGAEAEAAAAEAFEESLAGGGSLVDAFRAAVDASEQKGAEVARQAEEEEAESAELLGESIDQGLDNLLSQSRAAQEQGRSAAEAAEREQAGEQAQAAVEAGLTQDLNELAEAQARAQLESGFSRILTAEELAEIKAEKAAEAAAKAEAAAAAEAAAKAAAAAAGAGDDGSGSSSRDISGDDTFIAGTAPSRLTMGAGDDSLKFTSWADGGYTVTDYDSEAGRQDKIVLSGLSLKSVSDNGRGGVDVDTVSGRSLQFQIVDHTNLDLTDSDKVVFNLEGDPADPSYDDFHMAADTDASTAVDNFLGIYGDGEAKELTFSMDSTPGAASGIEALLIGYAQGGAGAGIYRFVDRNNDGDIDSGEVSLLAWLENVDVGQVVESDIIFATDPLIFDLDGDGVTLTGEGSGAAFDVDGDGVREKTGWMDDGDAMLVIDENQNGVIDGMSEVVSSYLTYGGGAAAGKSSLDALAQFDDNGDGQIDSADAVFSVLKLWKDADGDGVTDAGELLTLADFGITRIGLNGETAGREEDGGTVHRTAEAEKANGEKITVAEVSFDSGAEVQDDPTAGTSAA